MSAKDIVLGAAGAVAVATQTYVDDVFSTYLYTGNGATQTINNGIDLAGKGGLVWVKSRGAAFNNCLVDTVRGANQTLFSNDTVINQNYSGSGTINNFSSTGFNVGTNASTNATIAQGGTYASWTFRKAPKFFDIVTWTGDGNTYPASRTLNHSLGIAPGMIVIKVTSAVDDWVVYHAGLPSPTATYLRLNTTEAVRSGTIIDQVSSTSFRITDQLAYGADSLNQLNQTYVAYVFAHDTSATGIIQCGSFAAASGTNYVTLGFEPQFLLCKNTAAAEDWFLLDITRGIPVSTGPQMLRPNTSGAETNPGNYPVFPTATGFGYTNFFSGGNTYIYMAIRRPNKPPTSGTQVFSPVTRTNTGTATTVTSGFPVDTVIHGRRPSGGLYWMNRLTGNTQYMNSSSTEAEGTTYTGFDLSTGINLDASNFNDATFIDYFFKRASGFFDVVCYTGNATVRAIPHNLNTTPEFVIVKNRNASGVGNWIIWHKFFGVNGYMVFSSGTQSVFANYFPTLPTATNLNVGDGGAFGGVNAASTNYIAYLFATCSGVSKVDSYTGNGSSQTINCGFAAGARFIMIRRTDVAGDWYVWDSARGIIAANDPHLSLNTAAAEVTTDDSIDPDNSGFIVNQVAATNINVTSATYIFLAIA